MNGVTELALLSLLRAWNRERDASIVIGLNGRGEIEIRERDLFLSLRREVPEGLTDDGVIRDFLLMLVAEDENRRRRVRLLWIASWRLSTLARIGPTRIGIVLAICILLPQFVVAAIAPATYWPWPPMFRTLARKATATARPVSRIGVALVRVWIQFL